MSNDLPTDPPSLLGFILERVNARQEELAGSGLNPEGHDELARLARAITDPLSEPDSRSRWREFMSERDLGSLERLARRLQPGGELIPALATPLPQLLERLADQIEWCLEGLGVESDVRVLRDRLVQTRITDISRQLLVVERYGDVLDQLWSQTQQRLDQVVAVRTVGSGEQRRRQLEALAALQTGLVEIINSSAVTLDAWRLYRDLLAVHNVEQHETGEGTDETVSTMHRRHRLAFMEALDRLVRALDAELPPLPPELGPA